MSQAARERWQGETGQTLPATARDALAVTALTEAAYESARSGETVSVELES